MNPTGTADAAHLKPMPSAVKLVILHAPEDASLGSEFERHLRPLQRQGRLRCWRRGDLQAGQSVDEELASQIEAADVVALLLSADFAVDETLYRHEQRILARYDEGACRVFAVLVRSLHHVGDQLSQLPTLPVGGRPITQWSDRDAAWTQVVTGLRFRLKALSEPLAQYASRDARALGDELQMCYLQLQEQLEAGEDTLRQGPGLQAGEYLSEGRYRLLAPIGRGGFATVWRAADAQLRCTVAVKLLHGQLCDDRTLVERFYRGARVMADLQHPAVVKIIETAREEQGFHYFVMEDVQGGDLRRRILDQQMTPLDGLPAVREVADGLRHAHGRGVVHRDIKPANILLGRGGSAQLTDFDLVHASSTTGNTGSGDRLGSMLYAAPEAAQTADHRADIYSLGMTLLFVVSGNDLPIEALRDSAKFTAALPMLARLRRACLRAVAWEKSQRARSLDELCDALDEALLLQERRAPEGARSRWRLGQLLVLLGGASGLLLALFFAGRQAFRGRSASPGAPLERGAPSQVGEGAAPSSSAPGRGVGPKGGPPELRAALAARANPSYRPPMVRVAPGPFLMGSPRMEPWRAGDEGQRPVLLTHEFEVSQSEITQEQFQLLTGMNRSRRKQPGLPASNMTWYEALAYCNKLSEQEKLVPCYRIEEGHASWPLGFACPGYRLLTEAEWEFSARGGRLSRQTLYAGSERPAAVAWYDDEQPHLEVRAVIGKDANELGLFDMSGNVSEWVWDWYGPYPRERSVDPLGPATGSLRGVRGGAWLDPVNRIRVAARHGRDPGQPEDSTGFRIARTLSGM